MHPQEHLFEDTAIVQLSAEATLTGPDGVMYGSFMRYSFNAIVDLEGRRYFVVLPEGCYRHGRGVMAQVALTEALRMSEANEFFSVLEGMPDG